MEGSEGCNTFRCQRKAHLIGNLAKYMFKKRCRERGVHAFNKFLRLAGELYNPLKEPVDRLPQMGECKLDNEEIKEPFLAHPDHPKLLKLD